MDEMKKFNPSSPYFTGILAFIAGAVMIAWPSAVVRSLLTIVGTLLICIGALPILFSLIKRLPISMISVIFLVLGILVLAFQGFFLSMVMWIFGLVLILAAIHQFNILSIAKRNGVVLKFYHYIYSCVLLLAGVITMLNPFSSMEAVVMFFGFSLLFYGATLLLNEIALARQRRKITQE